jgi:outer membrane protein assembly factor BamB
VAAGVGVVADPVSVNAPVHLDGAVYASPIVADGATIVVTENNTIYRVDDGHVAWSRHVGAPVPGSELPCGNIDPSGMTGTPAYDATTSTVVVVALLDHPIRHVAYGIDPTTGRTRWSRTVDVSGEAGITPAAMQERGALLIDGGHVYIPYGGLAGDCSTYRGSVVDLDLAHPVTGALHHFTIPTSREAGIWAPAGPAVSPVGGILVADGNGATAERGTYDHSDSVLRLVDDRMVDSFSPSTWRQDNAQDLDLGSQGPTVVGRWVFIVGKRGTAYVLAGDHLGGIGGQVSQRTLCKSFGGTAVSGTTVYVPCADGVRAVRINADGTMTARWRAAANITGSPVIGGGRLWSLDPGAGVLYSLDPATGAVLGHWSVGTASRFATPALRRENGQNEVLVGTLDGLAAVHWA